MVECESYGVFNALIFLTVLIDTWWNVNEELEWFVDTVISFNRYMVECECVSLISAGNSSCVLIDTWWNVNFFCNFSRKTFILF